MNRYAPLSAAAVVIVTFMILVFLHCQKADDRIQECIKLGKDPHMCACTFTPGSTARCNQDWK